MCHIFLSTTYSRVLFSFCGVGLARLALRLCAISVYALHGVLSKRFLVLTIGACVMGSAETVFGMPNSSMATVKARTSRMRYGLNIRHWRRLYVLFTKTPAEGPEAVAKGGFSTKR